MKPKTGWAEYAELAGVFFLQMMALGIWLVPLTRILNAYGFSRLPAFAYATSAVAAFISPLVFGAMADRHASPVKVLRGLSLASAAATALASWAIGHAWPAPAVLCLIQLYSLVAVPTSSIASTIIFSRLRDSQRQYGPLRAAATFGWMCGCWLISGLNLDASFKAGFAGALVWLGLAAYTFSLTSIAPVPGPPMTFRERMGWDALALLKQHDHRIVFLTVALLSIPLAAFYPFSPPHLQYLGFHRTSAWMSLGQVTEMIAMFSLAALFARLRLKWIFAMGLFFSIVRFCCCAMNQPGWLLAGVTLHGFSFTLVFITAQIYLNERVETVWRARAQALMSLMTSGVGNLFGYVGTGFWFQSCSTDSATNWARFWSGLALAVTAVFLFFLIAYHGRRSGFRREPTR